MSSFREAVLLVGLAHAVYSAVPIIKAPWGSIQGIDVAGDGGRQMNGYLGIPYALPPVGDLRFERPQPHRGPGDDQVFVADRRMPPCPQTPGLIEVDRKTSEDCLMLDVYVPSNADKAANPLAVMIFIHGGGLTAGDAFSYQPSKLVIDGGVIVVIIQYRLATFGFLSTGDDTVKGNMGLWDQNLAIRWVHNNIRAFGGDPQSVTIFGESAGSMSVSLHLLSPQSKGLFQRVIMQSGSATFYSDMAGTFDSKQAFKGLVDACGCQGETTLEQLQCLKQMPMEEFLKKSTEYSVMSMLSLYFFPLVDGEFIPHDMRELLQDEEYMKKNGIQDIQIIFGLNSKEGALLLGQLTALNVGLEIVYSPHFYEGILSSCLLYHNFINNPVLKKSVEFFYLGADAGTKDIVSLDTMVDMVGDCLMNAPIFDLARSIAASSHSGGLYMYVLDHDFDFNKHGPVPGSHHCDELMLEFDVEREFPDAMIKRLNKTYLTDAEKPLAAKFNQIVTTFAKTGNPSSPVKDDVGGDWPEFTTDNEVYLSISNSKHVVKDTGLYKDGAALWLKLLPELKALTQESTKEETKEEGAAKDEL